jgi:hypothetical protein
MVGTLLLVVLGILLGIWGLVAFAKSFEASFKNEQNTAAADLTPRMDALRTALTAFAKAKVPGTDELVTAGEYVFVTYAAYEAAQGPAKVDALRDARLAATHFLYALRRHPTPELSPLKQMTVYRELHRALADAEFALEGKLAQAYEAQHAAR